MTDTLAKHERSAHMARIRSRDTAPEHLVRRGLHGAGFRYRLHATNLPGRPDLVLSQYRAVIFVHGCFWHRHRGCALAYSPKTRPEFWRQKLEANAERDRRQTLALKEAGWRVIVVWECGLRRTDRRMATLGSLILALRSSGKRELLELPPPFTPLSN
jgi:DNA mismatch endonuclease (patch repair protein)